jgi:hypothetical protein
MFWIQISAALLLFSAVTTSTPPPATPTISSLSSLPNPVTEHYKKAQQLQQRTSTAHPNRLKNMQAAHYHFRQSLLALDAYTTTTNTTTNTTATFRSHLKVTLLDLDHQLTTISLVRNF